jgi:hypothetical protein
MLYLDVLLTYSPNVVYTLSIVTADTQTTSVYGYPACAVSPFLFSFSLFSFLFSLSLFSLFSFPFLFLFSLFSFPFLFSFSPYFDMMYVYSLSLSIVPANATAPQQCLSNRPFPPSLNTPENLLTSPKVVPSSSSTPPVFLIHPLPYPAPILVCCHQNNNSGHFLLQIHLQEDFLVPTITSLYAKEVIVFNVSIPSYFRFYTEPHHIDIDLKLEENTTVVAQGISFNQEEVG